MKNLNFRLNLELFPGTGVSTVRDLKGTGDITSKRIVVDMAEDIAELEPDSSPLLLLIDKINKKRQVHNSEFDWQEDEYTPMYGAVDGIQVAPATLDMADVSMIRVNDIIMIPQQSPRVLLVTAVDVAGADIDITPLDGAAMFDVADLDKVARIGNAHEEGSGKRTILSTQPGLHDNYTQIFKTPSGATNTLDATKIYGGKELDKDRRKGGVEHTVEIQKSMLFGEKKKITTGAHPKRFMGGIVPRIESQIHDMSGAALTEAEWEKYMEKLFEYGSDTKYVFSSSKIYGAISAFAAGKLRMVSKDKTYGIHIEEYLSPHGTVYLINAKKILDIEPWKSMAIGLDLMNLKYVFLNGRDTKLETNIQDNGVDSKEDQFISEVSVEVRLEQTHALLEDVG